MSRNTQFSRFILVKYNYERSSLWRRMLVNAIASIDYALLSLPGIRNMAGYAVFYGHAQDPTSAILKTRAD